MKVETHRRPCTDGDHCGEAAHCPPADPAVELAGTAMEADDIRSEIHLWRGRFARLADAAEVPRTDSGYALGLRDAVRIMEGDSLDGAGPMTPDAAPQPAELDPAMVEAVARAILTLGRVDQDGYAVDQQVEREWADPEQREESFAQARAALTAAGVPALVDEVERLRRWKSEALPVMAGLQDLGEALGVGLGERITGEAAAEKARALVARATAAEQELEEARLTIRALVGDGPRVAYPPPEGVSADFTRACRACGGTVTVVAGNEQPHTCESDRPAPVVPSARIVAGDPEGVHQVMSAAGHEYHTGPGCGCRPAPVVPDVLDHPDGCECRACTDGPWQHPVVPDSPDVRSGHVHTTFDQEAVIQDVATDVMDALGFHPQDDGRDDVAAVIRRHPGLAVVGQGVTAEQEGWEVSALLSEDRYLVRRTAGGWLVLTRSDRAAVRPTGQEQADG